MQLVTSCINYLSKSDTRRWNVYCFRTRNKENVQVADKESLVAWIVDPLGWSVWYNDLYGMIVLNLKVSSKLLNQGRPAGHVEGSAPH